jgi:hypothetical protein
MLVSKECLVFLIYEIFGGVLYFSALQIDRIHCLINETVIWLAGFPTGPTDKIIDNPSLDLSWCLLDLDIVYLTIHRDTWWLHLRINSSSRLHAAILDFRTSSIFWFPDYAEFIIFLDKSYIPTYGGTRAKHIFWQCNYNVTHRT